MLYLATAGLVTFLCPLEVRAAAPPPLDGRFKHATVAASVSTPRSALASDLPPAKLQQPLDLRLPEAAAGGRPDERAASFPSFSRHDLIAMHGEREAVESLNVASSRSQRTPTRTEVLVNQFRRQGLPVARLWENDSALVHIGLNQKGKPGLWIVQKVQ